LANQPSDTRNHRKCICLRIKILQEKELMETLYTIICSAAAISGISYTTLILYFTYGWKKQKVFTSNQGAFHTQVSIIIPVRNEETNISNCLYDISLQDYPVNLFEVIIVDDSSTDQTVKITNDLINNISHLKINLLKLNSESSETGKKKAIAAGIKASTGKLIVTTDADCRMDNQWLKYIAAYYETRTPKMIVCPVALQDETLFGRMQSLEFLSLVGIACGAIKNANPILCNGANLAYEKNTFDEVSGFDDIDEIASGDDVLLMMKFKKRFPKSIAFLKSKQAIVYTKPQASFRQLINQRRRWASKNKHYKDSFVLGTGVIVWFISFIIIFTLFSSFISPLFVEIFFLLFTLKCIIDFLFLFLVTSFFNNRKLLWLFIPEQLLYIIYATFMGLSSFGGSYKWKGRKVK